MMIRILCIVAVWVSRKINLSGGWTAFFTLLVSAAMGFLATIVPVVTPVRTGYRPDCANRIDLRDSNIFTQHKLLEEALNSKTHKEEL